MAEVLQHRSTVRLPIGPSCSVDLPVLYGDASPVPRGATVSCDIALKSGGTPVAHVQATRTG